MIVPTLQMALKRRLAISATTAIWMARLCWLLFLFIPFSAALWLSSRAGENPVSMSRLGEERWFVGAMVFLALVAPGAFFCRERIYEGSQGGKNVTPGKYLAGMVSVWLTLLAAGLFSLTGCFAVGAMLPNIVPGFFALALFLMLWPNGRSMFHRVQRRSPPLHQVHHSAAD
jgi:hypothetical protein